jgi:UDP-N-acetylmuramate--alanine ligase
MSTTERPWAGRRLHFVGVGGAGMSAYARAAHELGAEVSGSDGANGSYLERLRADGVLEASIGHAAANVPAGSGVELVYSSAVPTENAERAAARERGLPERPRAELLAELSALRRTIAVAGTHGKTTTASMLAHALRAAGLDPGWLIGAPIGGGLANAHWSAGEWLVVEADESDRSMLSLSVEIAVLTNVELDHHATFSSLTELREAFSEFLAGASQAVVWDRPELLALREREVVAYDTHGLELLPGGSRFDWRGHEVILGVPGAHNALDAVGALAAAELAGADAAGAWATGRGARRSMRTTPTTRLRSRQRCGALRRCRIVACSPSSSHTSTRARPCSRASSALRWRLQTRSWCSTSIQRASGRRTIRGSAAC